MNCLITGATGNIGSRVVRRLLEAEIRPRILARDARKARRVYGARVDICVGDLADPSSLSSVRPRLRPRRLRPRG